nr:hypothetical protein [Tanacetum cinerariifolium]
MFIVTHFRIGPEAETGGGMVGTCPSEKKNCR